MSTVLIAAPAVVAPSPAAANPATVPGNVTITATGAYSGTIPNGVCAVRATVRGGAGGSSIAVANTNGAGAAVTATYRVQPGQAYSGTVGGGGQQSGTAGTSGGGAGGTAPQHLGAGGGGWSDLIVGAQSLIVAGGGGGSGGGHSVTAAAGTGGNAGLPSGSGVTAGSNGANGTDSPATIVVGSGRGGQTAAAGAGGVHSTQIARNGSAGSGRTGGQGGPDTTADSGGGGGGGQFGAGGGAATVSDGAPQLISGGGGGGGASFVAATSPDGASTAVASVSSALGPRLGGVGNGANGQVVLQWVPCSYDLQVTKSASPTTVSPGDTITWTVAVTNAGPDRMTQGDLVTIGDLLPGAGAKTITGITTSGGAGGGPLLSGAVTCNAAVGATMPGTLTCSRPYATTGVPGNPSGGNRGLNVNETLTITYTQVAQAADAGTLTNTATVTDRVGGTNTANASVTVVIPNPSISLDKQAGAIVDGDGNGHDVGDTIAFTFLVTNTGNVPLSSVGVSDPTVGAVTCPPGVLAPGGSKTCTATYALTQANVNAGVLNNTATASGTSSGGTTVTATDNTSTTITRTATLTLDKQAGPIVDGDANGHDVGDTIAYTFLVTNTGNVTLTSVGVTDPKVGTVSCPLTTLAPGASTTCTATYALTQADVNAGVVNNTATATGTPPAGVTAPTPATDNTSTPVNRTSAIALDKQAGPVVDGDGNGPDVGDTIAYSFIVTNTGNVTLSAVAVTDPTAGTVTCPPGALAPGASTTCTASYTLTEADVDAGHVANTATATGTPPAGVTAPTPATDSTDTLVPSGPAIVLDKQAGPIVDGDANGHDVGDTIAYSFVVTNTGNVTLTAVGVTDAKVGAVTCPPGYAGARRGQRRAPRRTR